MLLIDVECVFFYAAYDLVEFKHQPYTIYQDA